MTTPNALTALAEACERAAELLRILCFSCDVRQRGGGITEADLCTHCRLDNESAVLLTTHARALREGRVTISEEESPDA